MPDFVGLNSSAIRDVRYNGETQELTITFKKDGTTYTYSGVSQSDYAALLYAMSHGQQFNFNIRNDFPYRRGG
jgi:hypothetical protein